MASITISNLGTAGSALFVDSESYLNELTDEEKNETQGGTSVIFTPLIPFTMTLL
jgi:hypothetical protein